MSENTYEVTTLEGTIAVVEESPWYAVQVLNCAVEDIRLVMVDGECVDTTEAYDRAVRAEAYEDEDTTIALCEVPDEALEKFADLTETTDAIVDNDGTVYTVDGAGVAAQKFEFVYVSDELVNDTELRVDLEQPLTEKTYIATLREFMDAAQGTRGLTLDDILDRGYRLNTNYDRGCTWN